MYIPANEEEKAYLENYDPNKYAKPCVTVDLIVNIDGLGVLFVKRKNYPYKDHWALPGGFLDVGKENTMHAAIRELKEETNLDVNENQIKLVGVYSDPERDPRDHVVDIVYTVELDNSYVDKIKAGDDAKETAFFTIHDLFNIDLAFDHAQILMDWIK